VSRALAGIFGSLVRCELVGALIGWHKWRGGRANRARMRHAAALAALAELAEREAEHLDRISARFRP
jgi:hypothetical protein